MEGFSFVIMYQNGIRPTVFLLKFIADEKNYPPNLNKKGDKNNLMSPVVIISIVQIQLLNLLFFQLQACLEMHGISG